MGAAARVDGRPVVFLDSNVIFSGLHSPRGAPGSILRDMIDGRIDVVVSRQILEEVIRTFKRELPQALPALSEFLLSSPISVVSDPTPEESAPWTEMQQKGDACIMAAAIAAEPDFFVTGDRHFLNNARLKKTSSVVICSPAQLLESLEPDDKGGVE